MLKGGIEHILAVAVFDAWMKSSGHRKNMLDPTFEHYGLAWATPENKPTYIYWAMMLGL